MELQEVELPAECERFHIGVSRTEMMRAWSVVKAQKTVDSARLGMDADMSESGSWLHHNDQ